MIPEERLAAMRDVALLQSKDRCNPYHKPGCSLCIKANPLAKIVLDLLDYIEELSDTNTRNAKNAESADEAEDVYF